MPCLTWLRCHLPWHAHLIRGSWQCFAGKVCIPMAGVQLSRFTRGFYISTKAFDGRNGHVLKNIPSPLIFFGAFCQGVFGTFSKKFTKRLQTWRRWYGWKRDPLYVLIGQRKSVLSQFFEPLTIRHFFEGLPPVWKKNFFKNISSHISTKTWRSKNGNEIKNCPLTPYLFEGILGPLFSRVWQTIYKKFTVTTINAMFFLYCLLGEKLLSWVKHFWALHYSSFLSRFEGVFLL